MGVLRRKVAADPGQPDRVDDRRGRANARESVEASIS